MGHWLENDNELGGKLQREGDPFSRRDFDRVDNNLIEQLLEVFGQDEAAPPENLAVVLPPRKAIGVMRCNLANSRTYSEGYFHHLVECGLVPSGAESAA